METTLYVTRDGFELELTVVGRYLPAERDVGLGAGFELDEVLLDDAPWTGSLTDAEHDRALAQLSEKAADYDDASDYYDDDTPPEFSDYDDGDCALFD